MKNNKRFKIDFWTTVLRRRRRPSELYSRNVELSHRVSASSIVSAPPRRTLLRRSTYIERERLPRLLRSSLILLLSFHRKRARRFVDGLRRAPVVVVWHFNPKVFDDCIDFPFELFRALNLALIASLLLSAFQRG